MYVFAVLCAALALGGNAYDRRSSHASCTLEGAAGRRQPAFGSDNVSTTANQLLIGLPIMCFPELIAYSWLSLLVLGPTNGVPYVFSGFPLHDSNR